MKRHYITYQGEDRTACGLPSAKHLSTRFPRAVGCARCQASQRYRAVIVEEALQVQPSPPPSPGVNYLFAGRHPNPNPPTGSRS